MHEYTSEGADQLQGSKIIYVAKGDYLNATFSGISLVPMAGDATGKGLKYTIKIIENSSSAGKNVVGILRKIPVEQLIKFIKKIYSLPAAPLQRLFKNFIENPVLLEKVALNQKLVDSWKRIDDHLGEAGELVRKNPEALQKVDDAIMEGLDATDAIEDAIQTLGKTKPTWDKIKALFKRGNDFNRKAKTDGWYDYHEIHLANGKRLDSYDPDLGEIVSRKATEFDNIQPSTFKNFLKEIDNKYAPGTVIRSNKYPDIDGQTLQGKKILEVPASNQTSFRLAEFQQMADDYGVKLRFQPK